MCTCSDGCTGCRSTYGHFPGGSISYADTHSYPDSSGHGYPNRDAEIDQYTNYNADNHPHANAYTYHYSHTDPNLADPF